MKNLNRYLSQLALREQTPIDIVMSHQIGRPIELCWYVPTRDIVLDEVDVKIRDIIVNCLPKHLGDYKFKYGPEGHYNFVVSMEYTEGECRTVSYYYKDDGGLYLKMYGIVEFPKQIAKECVSELENLLSKYFTYIKYDSF